MRIRLLSSVLTVLLVIPTTAQTPTASTGGARREDVVRFLQLIGSDKLIRQALDQMLTQQLASMQQLRPDIPPKFWTEFQELVQKEVNPNELVELIVPIYQRHFTEDEMRQLVSFYETPLGRKVATELPQVQKEAMAAGGEWGRNLGQRIGREAAERLAQQGYKTGTPPQPPQK
jgi:hypothetical protein